MVTPQSMALGTYHSAHTTIKTRCVIDTITHRLCRRSISAAAIAPAFLAFLQVAIEKRSNESGVTTTNLGFVGVLWTVVVLAVGVVGEGVSLPRRRLHPHIMTALHGIAIGGGTRGNRRSSRTIRGIARGATAAVGAATTTAG